MKGKHKQKGPQEYTKEYASDATVVPVWWRWDPADYDKEKYPVEPAMDDPVWQQPEWDKPVYEYPDGWSSVPPQGKPDQPSMHYKPWEPEPDGYKEPEPDVNIRPDGYKEPKPNDYTEPDSYKEPNPDVYIKPDDYKEPKPDVYKAEPQNPNNIYININIDNSSNANSNSNAEANASAESVAKAMAGSLSFAASHSHGGEYDQYHEFIDDLLDWGEATYKDIMPTHKDSYAVADYYARIYDNGQAVGEKNGQIYYYDGYEIKLVGTTEEIADMAGMQMMGG